MTNLQPFIGLSVSLRKSICTKYCYAKDGEDHIPACCFYNLVDDEKVIVGDYRALIPPTNTNIRETIVADLQIVSIN